MPSDRSWPAAPIRAPNCGKRRHPANLDPFPRVATVRYRELGLDTRILLFRLGVGTMLGQLSPKPTMYRSQQMRICGLKSDLCTVRQVGV